jgi:hypothetical protein
LKLFDWEELTEDLDPFFDLKLGKEEVNTRRCASFAELVRFVFDDETLDQWISFNVNRSKELPKIFYGKNKSVLLIIVIIFLVIYMYTYILYNI